MVGSNHLYELIKSLTPHEKRYFKMQCRLQKGEKKYLKLFNLIDDQDFYDEGKIIIFFEKDEKTSRSLHVIKNYLYNLILKTLRSSHSKNNIDHRIYNNMIDVLLLENRGLYYQARKSLNKVKKLASKYHRLPLLVLIARKEISYLFSLDKKQLQMRLEALNEQFTVLTEKLTLESTLFVFYYRLTMLEKTNIYTFEKMEVIIEDWVQFRKDQIFAKEKSFYSIYLLECIESSIAKLKANPKKRLDHYRKAIQTWEAHPQFIKEEPHVYKIHLANLLNCYFANKQWHSVPGIVKKIKDIPSRNFNEEASNFQATAFYELLYFLNNEKLGDAESALEEIIIGIEKYLSKINKSRELTFYYNISVLYFLLGKFQKALFWLNKILHLSKTDHKKNIQRFAQLLQLIYHFELGNFTLLEHLLENVRRKLSKHHALSSFEKILLNGLKRIINEPFNKAHLTLISQLQHDVKIASKSSNELGIEEILIWTRKIMKKGYIIDN